MLDIKDGSDTRALIDELIAQKDSVYRSRVQISTTGGGYGYFGEIIERKGNWVVFKVDTRYGMAEGVSKGEEIFAYSYIRIDCIVSIGFEMLEKKGA